MAVVETPVFPGRRDQHAPGVAIGVLIARGFVGFGVADEGVGECHGIAPPPVTVFTLQKLRDTVNVDGMRVRCIDIS